MSPTASPPPTGGVPDPDFALSGADARRARPLVMFVSSSGGHLDQLMRLERWWHHVDRLWVTFDLPDARSRLEGERVIWGHHPTTRNLVNLGRNLALASRLIGAHRPDVVVSTGAGIAVPFFTVARVRGVKTVFLEVYDRVSSPTLTGRICRPLAHRFLVQWPAQLELYPGATLIGSVYP